MSYFASYYFQRMITSIPIQLATVLKAFVTLGILRGALSFVHQSPSFTGTRLATRLNIEKHIADMIDNELLRLSNIDLWRQQQAEKLKKEKEQTIPQGFSYNSASDFLPTSDAINKIQMRRDKRMARDDPARYCADRCVATGNFDVWEETFEMSPEEVQKFCKECVLSEDEEPCDVPQKFIDNAGKNIWELNP